MLSHLVTSPLSYITLFIVAGYLFRRREKLKWAMYATAAVLALLFSTPALLQHAQKQWYAEYDHPLPEGANINMVLCLADTVYGTTNGVVPNTAR